jgi:tetratricopeptide (TPR) repeat protein
MNRAAFVCALFPTIVLASHAQETHQHGAAGRQPPPAATLRTGLGSYHKEITTTSREAQAFFDQGLTLLYGFNHGGAMRMFRRASELDPTAPMPLWGLALALGPHINNPDVDPDSEKLAAETIAKARQLAATRATPAERAYIDALAVRYSSEEKPDLRALDRAYEKAMADVAKRFPDDLDAQTLHAESLMDLRPWALWAIDGTPSDLTPQIVEILESVLRRGPNHPGANHYYIHAVEASPNPGKALPAARRLETLVPEAGHLVHMPAHIYMRTGDFDAAVHSNAAAAAIDERFIQQTGSKVGLYPLMYYNHNVHFESAAAAMAGRYADAKRAADKLVSNVSPFVVEMPMIEAFLPQSLFVLVRFNRWSDVLAAAAPPAEQRLTTAFWHYSRALAYAATRDLASADREQQAFRASVAAIPRDTPVGTLNRTGPVFDIAAAVVDARIATAKGDRASAIARWKAAVDVQDKLYYDEPPAWYYPVRESLGAALLQDGQAAEAERIFRRDLELNPGNGRSLFGLWRSLDAQKKSADAAAAKSKFDAAWKSADASLKVEEL